jgi:hypothetical protein
MKPLFSMRSNFMTFPIASAAYGMSNHCRNPRRKGRAARAEEFTAPINHIETNQQEPNMRTRPLLNLSVFLLTALTATAAPVRTVEALVAAAVKLLNELKP